MTLHKYANAAIDNAYFQNYNYDCFYNHVAAWDDEQYDAEQQQHN